MQIFKHTMKSNSTMTLDEILEDSSNIHLLNSHITEIGRASCRERV